MRGIIFDMDGVTADSEPLICNDVCTMSAVTGKTSVPANMQDR